MNRTLKAIVLAVLPALLTGNILSPAAADSISPNINNGDREYSEEKPESSFYGSGYTGRMAEASQLRFEADELMADGKLEEARKKIGKAVMLDPGTTDGHIMYARCITRMLYAKKTLDEKLLSRCIEEWKLIWHHDADQIEQVEAKAQAKTLMRIAKELEKQKKDNSNEPQQSLASTGKKSVE